MRKRRATLSVKRAIDVIGAATAAVVFGPILVAIAIAIWATHGRPILFRQLRPGLHGRLFTIVKFRTMRPTREGEVSYLTDSERVSRLGRLLRSTSLDELPELWNVLRGEMSLVGPRPLHVEYLDHYSTTERRRHDMRPGITGWAVVNGRNSLRFRDRLRLDVWYVEHRSLALDFKIIARTIADVARRKDVSTIEDLSLGFPLPGLDNGVEEEDGRWDVDAMNRADGGAESARPSLS